MVDYSFLRLKDSFEQAKNIGDSPTATHTFFDCIQFSPNEAYSQITNVTGGISFSGDYEAYLVDCNNEVVKDIKNNVFIEEFILSNGNTQCSIEIININEDFYRKTLYIRLDNTVSNVSYWSNPVNVTDYRIWETSYFQYKNYDDFEGIGYTNAQKWQSIRLRCYFDIPVDESEVSDYFQISRNKTISARALIKRFEQYKIEYINSFTFVRLNTLLKHDLIYLNGVRVTNKPIAESEERLGESNYFPTQITCALNYNDTLNYEYQIFEGFELTTIDPQDTYTECTLQEQITGQFNSALTIGTGNLTVYDASDNSVVHIFTQDDINNDDAESFVIEDFLEYITGTGNYYILFDEGLFISTFFGLVYPALTDPTVWAFSVSESDYSNEDYSDDYLVGCPNPIVDNLSLFYKFNETSGTTATDSSGNGIDGTVVNANINQTGLIDKCYEFNNGTTDEYVSIPDNDLLSFGSGDFGIEIWLNPATNFGRVINKYNATTGDLEWRLFIQSGVIQFFAYTDASNYIGIADNATIGVGSWQQVFVTYDSVNGLSMKINNIDASFSSVETGTYTGIINTSQPVIIGQQANDLTGSNRYSGLIDILRIWKGYAPTEDEKTALYNSGNGTES